MEVNGRCTAGAAALHTGFIFKPSRGLLSTPPPLQEYIRHVEPPDLMLTPGLLQRNILPTGPESGLWDGPNMHM